MATRTHALERARPTHRGAVGSPRSSGRPVPLNHDTPIAADSPQFSLTAKRVGNAWLVAQGGSGLAQRVHVLTDLRINKLDLHPGRHVRRVSPQTTSRPRRRQRPRREFSSGPAISPNRIARSLRRRGLRRSTATKRWTRAAPGWREIHHGCPPRHSSRVIIARNDSRPTPRKRLSVETLPSRQRASSGFGGLG